MSLANQAAALEGLKKWPEALELYEKSSSLLKEIGEKELRAYVLKRHFQHPTAPGEAIGSHRFDGRLAG